MATSIDRKLLAELDRLVDNKVWRLNFSLFPRDQYELLDFGDGRRLERFGGITLDRPCPTAEGISIANPAAWQRADARFQRGRGEEGQWSCRRPIPEQWLVAHGNIKLELKRTAVGHLGLFPEHAANWDWLAEQIRAVSRPLKILNLFAYTGGSTLAAAAAGAEVVHLDAARNTNTWARRNAELSGMADLAIHWISEDALKFVKRELRRGNGYDGVILDPPSYGHGPHGEVWRLSQHLGRLLKLCGALTAGRRQFILLTCHTPGFDAMRLKEMMTAALQPAEPDLVTAEQLILPTAAGRILRSGVVVRCLRSPLSPAEGCGLGSPLPSGDG